MFNPDEETKPRVQIPLILANMVTEINNADPDAFPPTDPVQDSEKVIAKIDDVFIRRLYSLFSFYRRESLHALVDLRYSATLEDSTSGRLSNKADTLRELFWWMVHETYSHHPNYTIGVRSGWVLVQVPQNSENPIKKLFEGLI